MPDQQFDRRRGDKERFLLISLMLLVLSSLFALLAYTIGQ